MCSQEKRALRQHSFGMLGNPYLDECKKLYLFDNELLIWEEQKRGGNASVEVPTLIDPNQDAVLKLRASRETYKTI